MSAKFNLIRSCWA